MSKCTIYTRFSPQRNADDKDSCDTQEEICRRLAKEHSLDVLMVAKDEAISGKDEFRPKLWECIEMLGPGDSLLVWKRDRLARNVYLGESINRAVAKRGAKIIAAEGDVDGDTPEAILVRQVVAAISEFERKVTAARTSAAMLSKQRRGIMMSARPPYGYKPHPGNKEGEQKKLAKVASEQEMIEVIREKHGTGWEIRSIVGFLNRKHKEHCRGECWSSRTVAGIVKREMA